MPNGDEAVRLFSEALKELRAIRLDFNATREEKERAEAAADRLLEDQRRAILDSFEGRTAALHVLLERLTTVIGGLSTDALEAVKARLGGLVAEAREAAIDAVREVVAEVEAEEADDGDPAGAPTAPTTAAATSAAPADASEVAFPGGAGVMTAAQFGRLTEVLGQRESGNDYGVELMFGNYR